MKRPVLLEIRKVEPNPFELYEMSASQPRKGIAFAEQLLKDAGIAGVEVTPTSLPVPLLLANQDTQDKLIQFSGTTSNPEIPSDSFIIPCLLDTDVTPLPAPGGLFRVWPDSELTFWPARFDDLIPHSGGGSTCSPFPAAVSLEEIRRLLGVEPVWWDGFKGQNIVVGVLDSGIDGNVYPVIGGTEGEEMPVPGKGDILGHGSMCAAGVLVAAPECKLHDYPFVGHPRSGGALGMMQAVLDRRRRDGTPHIVSNSYGYRGIPPRDQAPDHEVHNIEHPVHRKVRELVSSGCMVFYAAGNCGDPCALGACHSSGIGPGKSIHGSNSLEQVITVAAVDARRKRLGYSSQGPGLFHREKPDISAYTHYFGNFGEGRPGGASRQPYDDGTSSACPMAAGVAALLLSAFPSFNPSVIRRVMIETAIGLGHQGWDADTGHGVINVAAAYTRLKAM